MRSSTLFLAVAAAAASAASAHFVLDYPQNRGFDEDIESQFCGGFPNAGNRTAFPLSGGPIQIDSHHETAQVAVVISFDDNPANFSAFNATSNGTAIPYLIPFFTINGEGEYCVRTPNISAVYSNIVTNLTNGTNATIQVVYNGGDGALYQCADVFLSADFDASNITCTNGTSSHSDDDNASAAATSSSAAAAPGSNNAATSVPSTSPSSTGGASSKLLISSGAIASLIGAAALSLWA